MGSYAYVRNGRSIGQLPHHPTLHWFFLSLACLIPSDRKGDLIPAKDPIATRIKGTRRRNVMLMVVIKPGVSS